MQRQQEIYSLRGFTHWKLRLEPLIQAKKLVAVCLQLCIQVGLAWLVFLEPQELCTPLETLACLPPDKFRT